MTQYFDYPRYLANEDQDTNQIEPIGGFSASVVVGATLKSLQQSRFGTNKISRHSQYNAASYRSSGYISDISPLIDTQTLSMAFTNNVIDNQVTDASEPASGSRNKPVDWVNETDKRSGSSPSKHLTKIVQLNEGSEGIRVFVDAYVPPAANFVLYYRTGTQNDDDLYQNDWIEATPENSPGKDVWVKNETTQNYSEYKYLIGGRDGDLPTFLLYQLKIVLKTTNTCQSPVINSIRTIALL